MGRRGIHHAGRRRDVRRHRPPRGLPHPAVDPVVHCLQHEPAWLQRDVLVHGQGDPHDPRRRVTLPRRVGCAPRTRGELLGRHPHPRVGDPGRVGRLRSAVPLPSRRGPDRPLAVDPQHALQRHACAAGRRAAARGGRRVVPGRDRHARGVVQRRLELPVLLVHAGGADGRPARSPGQRGRDVGHGAARALPRGRRAAPLPRHAVPRHTRAAARSVRSHR